MEGEVGIDSSLLVASAHLDDEYGVEHKRNMIKKETEVMFEDSVLHSGDSKEVGMNKYLAPGILRLQPRSLESQQTGMLRTFDRYVYSMTERYRRIAEELMIKAREEGTSGEGVELFEQFLNEFNERIRPLMKDNITAVTSLVERVEDTASFYGNVETVKKELIKLTTTKRLSLSDAVDRLYRTNISNMGVLTMGDITGLMMDRLWSIFSGISDQWKWVANAFTFGNFASLGIGSLVSIRGYYEIEKKVLETFSTGARYETKTTLGDAHADWLFQVMIYLHREISARQLHAIVPHMEWTSVLGHNAINGYKQILKVLNTRPGLSKEMRRDFIRRFNAERPSHFGSNNPDQWMRPSYVRVKIPLPQHDEATKDIKPTGEEPTEYKYVWGIRIIVGGPSKGMTPGAARFNDRGTNQAFTRHMDTYRSDLLINLFIKSQIGKKGMREHRDKPWLVANQEFKLMQFIYKPPEESKIYRLMSPATVLRASTDLFRKDMVDFEWKRRGMRSISHGGGIDAIIGYKITRFITFIKFVLIHALRGAVDTRAHQSLVAVVKNTSGLFVQKTLPSLPELHSLKFLDLNEQAERMVERYELNKVVGGSPLISHPIGIIRFIQGCKDAMWGYHEATEPINIAKITANDIRTFSLIVPGDRQLTQDRVRRNQIFLDRYLQEAFSTLIEYHAHRIAIYVHEEAISTPVGGEKDTPKITQIPRDGIGSLIDDIIYIPGSDPYPLQRDLREHINSIFSRYYLREFSTDTNYFKTSGLEDVNFPLSREDINQSSSNSVPFRKIAPSNPPPVIIVIFDSGAPDARRNQDNVDNDETFYGSLFQHNMAAHPTRYWNSDDPHGEGEIMPMSYDVEYDVDGYVDLDFSEEGRETVYNLDDIEVEEERIFLRENNYIYLPHRTQSAKKRGETENPYYKGVIKKRGIVSKDATISFCDIRSLIGRSSLGGLLHSDGTSYVPYELREGDDPLTDLGIYPEIHGLFQHLQWPSAIVFDPMAERPSPKSGKLHVEVIAKYDNDERWSAAGLSPFEFSHENWNRTESWGLSKASRREVEVPLPPILDHPSWPLWRQTRFDESFPDIFKQFDQVDIRQWRRVAEYTQVGATPRLKRELEDTTNSERRVLAYANRRFLPREISPTLFTLDQEQYRSAINTVDRSPLSIGRYSVLPITEEDIQAEENYNRSRVAPIRPQDPVEGVVFTGDGAVADAYSTHSGLLDSPEGAATLPGEVFGIVSPGNTLLSPERMFELGWGGSPPGGSPESL